MKVIDTETHGYLDYVVGALLIASPWIFDFMQRVLKVGFP